MHLYANPYLEEHVKKHGDWCRARIKNYADKKGISLHMAIYNLIRKSKTEQTAELDNLVDPEYHSSTEPQLK